MRVKAEVKKIFYPKVESLKGGEWAIVSFIPKETIEGEAPKVNKYRTFSVKGTMCALKEGDIIEMDLKDEEESKYGFTYTLAKLHLSLKNLDDNELKKYVLEIVTSDRVKNQLKEIPNLAEVIRNKDVETLKQIKGLGEATIDKMYEKINKKINIHKAIAELNQFGFTDNIIQKICEAYDSPERAVEEVKQNPYGLIKKVHGVGYTKADEIALKIGLDRKSPYRIEAAVEYILENNGESGRSYLDVIAFVQELQELLGINYNYIKPILTKMKQSKRIILSAKGKRISLYEYVKLENELALSFLERIKAPLTIPKPENWLDTVRQIEKEQGWNYTEEQIEAIEMVLDNNVCVITGLAGTGKTTVVYAVERILCEHRLGTCALSAKAAQRIEEVTGKPSYTIHRMFGLFEIGLYNALKNRNNKKIAKERKCSYVDNDEKPAPHLNYKGIVFDEGSMINGTIFLEALNHTGDDVKIIILGDPGQLTAIGNCSVLADLIASDVVPSKNLTIIHRQAQKSAMITESINIRMQNKIYHKDFRGKKILGELQDLELHVYDEPSDINETIVETFIRDLDELGDVLEVQIILPMKNRGINSCKPINNKIQDLLIKDKEMGLIIKKDVNIYEGDKVINTKNNYKARSLDGSLTEIFNGNIGIVDHIDFANETVTVKFTQNKTIVFDFEDAKNLDLAYAITVHSSQGSAWKKTILAIDNSSYIMLNCELVYTGMTRAYNYCTLIVEHKAMEKAIRTAEQKTKATFLKNFLSLNVSGKSLNI